MKKKVYACTGCGKTFEAANSKTDHGRSDCCNLPLSLVEELPVCMKTDTAEHHRAHDADEPCDDSRNAKNTIKNNM